MTCPGKKSLTGCGAVTSCSGERPGEIMYERANTPTPAEEAERVRKLNLRRSQNTATLGEIWSAKALNDLLDDLRRVQGKKVDLPAIPSSPPAAIA